MIRLALVAFLGVGCAWAQSKAPSKKAPATPKAATAYPLQNLKVEGAHHVSAEKIIEQSGLRLGRLVNRDDFEAARKRLVETGAFETVGYEFKPGASGTGYDAVLEVTEFAEYYPFRFEDLPAKDETVLAAIAQQKFIFGEQIPVTPAIVAKYAEAIEASLGGKVHVAGKLGRVEKSGEVAVIFQPQEGRPSIALVRFEGNSVVPEDLLLNTFAEAAIGVPYIDSEVRRRLDSSVRKLYEARGRIGVSFPKITASKAEKINGVVVTVTVQEGEPYKLGKLQVTGVAPSEAAKLVRMADLSKGDIANFDDVAVGVDKIRKHFLAEGYLKATETMERKMDDGAHTVDLVLKVEPGAQYRYGKLKIEGLDLLSEPAIRKMWGDREGKPYQDGAAEAFLERVKQEDLFENLQATRPETKIDDQTRIVDITLYFTGGKQEKPKDKRGGQGRVPLPLFPGAGTFSPGAVSIGL